MKKEIANTKRRSNSRGITLGSIVRNIYARIVTAQLKGEDEQILKDTRSEFRRGRGTEDRIFILDQITENAAKMLSV